MAESHLKDLQALFRTVFGVGLVVDIFRHGHAAQAKPDFNCHLSEKGREQSRALGAAIADIPYDLVLCSPTPRAIHTGLIAISESRPTVTARFCVAQGLATYAPNERKMFDEIFRIIDVVNNLKYLDYRAIDTMSCFAAFQVESLQALFGIKAGPDVKKMALFNHGVIGSFIAEAILGALKEVTPGDQEVLNNECPPCGCFRVSRLGVQFIDFLKN